MPSPSTTTPGSSTSSRKGGVEHVTRDWFSSPAGTDPAAPSPVRVSHRSIDISAWTVTTSRGAIGNSAYMDELGQKLGVPPPEMVFPSNTLVVTHKPSGFTYRFTADEALRCVDGVDAACKLNGADLSQGWRASSANHHGRRQFGEKPKRKNKAIKVAYAQEWGKSRTDPVSNPALAAQGQSSSSSTTQASSSADSPTSSAPSQQPNTSAAPPSTAFGAAAATQIAEARDYDWTYSTTWAGAHGSVAGDSHPDFADASGSAFAPGTDPSRDRIPVERLGPSSGEPILFYDDLVLFEDELGDNGSSMLGVKVRVMPSGFLVLQRFFLRVDDVLFRLYDTRMYCEFDDTGSESPSSSTTNSMHRTAMPEVVGPGVGAQSGRVAAPAAAPWARQAKDGSSSRTLAATGIPNLNGLSLGQPRNLPSSSKQTQDRRAPQQRLIREISGCEAPYKDVKARLPPYRPNDLSLLTDPGWVSQTLQTITARQFAATRDESQHPALAATHAAQAVLPARLPSFNDKVGNPTEKAEPGALPASVLGELGEDNDVWEGVGQRVDVAALQ